MGTHFLTTKAPQPNRYCKYRTVNTRQSYLDPNQKQSKTHNNPSPCQRRRPPREPLRPEPRRRRRTPTRPSVVSLHTCSSQTSNARTFVMRTLESASARLARFSVSAGRHSTRSNEPHTRQRLLKTRSVMRMKRQATMLMPKRKSLPRLSNISSHIRLRSLDTTHPDGQLQYWESMGHVVVGTLLLGFLVFFSRYLGWGVAFALEWE